MTVGEFYRHTTEQVSLPDVNLDSDLAAIFNASKRQKTSEPAGAFLRKNRKALADHIAAWTAMQRPMVRKLMEAVEKRSDELDLKIDRRKEAEYLSEFTVFVTTLVMNHLAREQIFSGVSWR